MAITAAATAMTPYCYHYPLLPLLLLLYTSFAATSTSETLPHHLMLQNDDDDPYLSKIAITTRAARGATRLLAPSS